nr:PREDICTED: uncharacterized protein LOC100875173 [Megachile rotundata]XP_012152787.1 PREDICTED: uncharacterized protein LOC100875173 [Megachile rotundata]
MEAIWNNIQLERPPNITCYVKREKFDTTAFLKTLEKIIKDLTSQKLLHKEAAILSRIIYRMKTKFRNDKGVKFMLKVNKTLLNYLHLQLKKEYENLKDFVEINNDYVTLPSKQMIEYVLVRTQGFAKLVLRMEEVSKLTAHFLRSRIGIGHAWTVATIAYAIISRIWVLSRYLVKQSCIWYNDLYQYLKSFKVSGIQWLPDNYEFPNDLKLWLSVPWIEEPIPSVPSSYGLQSSIFKLIIPGDYESDEDLIFDTEDNSKPTNADNALLSQKKENITSSITPTNEKKSIVSDNDTGEVIDRRTFYLERVKNVAIVPKEKKHKGTTKIKDTEEKIHHEVINTQKSDFKVVNDRNENVKQYKNPIIKQDVTKKEVQKKVSTFNKVKNKSDLEMLLNKDSYPGLDKLQWNIIRNKSKKLLNELNACSSESKQGILLKKIKKRIQLWIA